MTQCTPKVSVGVPVRNGAATLGQALDAVLAQDHQELEVLISDNASTDATADICAEYIRRDSRVRYVRQSEMLSGWENFRFVFENTESDYFMWAAADDLRDVDYVSRLLSGYTACPTASIVFGEVRWFADHADLAQNRPFPYSCDTRGKSLARALGELYRRHFSYEIYGLIRRSALDGYAWYDTDNGADFLTLIWLLSQGPVVQVCGSTFWYYRDPIKQTAEERAKYFFNSRLRMGKDWRLSWQGSRVLKDCDAALGCRLPWALYLYWAWKRGLPGLLRSLYHHLPVGMRRLILPRSLRASLR